MFGRSRGAGAPRRQRSGRATALLAASATFSLFLIAAIVAAWSVFYAPGPAARGGAETTIVTLPSGAGVNAIAANLKAAGAQTPIANPGREALAAVLNPPPSDELFFVADGSGGHAFARTYEEHLANVARWREIERRKAGLPPGSPPPAVPGTVPGVPNAHPDPATVPPGVVVPPGAQVIRVPQQAPAQ